MAVTVRPVLSTTVKGSPFRNHANPETPMFNIATRKVGGIRFVKVGRLCIAFTIARRFRPSATPRPSTEARPLCIELRRTALLPVAAIALAGAIAPGPANAGDGLTFKASAISRMASAKKPAPRFWLVEAHPSTHKTRFVDGFESAYACHQATFVHHTATPGGFATCIATRSEDERALARAVADYGRTACERADLSPTPLNVEACLNGRM